MANTPENLKKMSDKAKKSPKIGKHGQWKKTLEKNQQREEYLKFIAENFHKLTAAQMKNITKPAAYKERQYVIDQFVGKAKESVEVVGDIILRIDI